MVDKNDKRQFLIKEIYKAEGCIKDIRNAEHDPNTEWNLGYWEGRRSLAEEILKEKKNGE